MITKCARTAKYVVRGTRKTYDSSRALGSGGHMSYSTTRSSKIYEVRHLRSLAPSPAPLRQRKRRAGDTLKQGTHDCEVVVFGI